ncbi:MAG: formamidopyrimidine-DNA glycosylase, partial [Burkholderiaceae bacterium]|nr:formamidopyrimidine-DNA glycosylase [Burkholderiaceae bacterium]
MPELPEVEVTRRSFVEAITGARIDAVTLGKPLRWPLGCDPQVL